MAKAKTLVGLDVHATKIVAAVLDAETDDSDPPGPDPTASRYRRG